MNKLSVFIFCFLMTACSCVVRNEPQPVVDNAETAMPPTDLGLPELEPSLPIMTAPAPVIAAPVPNMSTPPRQYSITLAKDILNKDSVLPENYSAIVFKSKPLTIRQKKARDLWCEAWKSSSEYKSSYTDKELKAYNVISFYWFTQTVSRGDCDKLIEDYDLKRAQLLTRDLRLRNTDDYLVLRYKDQLLYLYITDIEDEQDISRAVDVWKSITHELSSKSKSGEVRLYDFYSSAKKVLSDISVFVIAKI